MTSGKSGNRRTPTTRTSGTTSAAKRLADERAAAARERIAAAQRKRRLFVVGGSVLGVLVVVAALIIVKVATGAGGPESGTKATTASGSVVSEVLAVPADVLDQVGAGSVNNPPTGIDAPALTSGGKPMLFYAGAEYCPFCAAERWGLAVALSRFGTLKGLGQTASSPSDAFPSTQTLSFHGATYTSKYLALAAKELESNQVVNGQYAPLDKLTAAEQAIYAKYDTKPYVDSDQNPIPFLDFGGKYISSGASYGPGVLQKLSHQQIADALSDPDSDVAKGVDGTANVISATICTLTSQQPASVCTSAGVKAGAKLLSSAGSS